MATSAHPSHSLNDASDATPSMSATAPVSMEFQNIVDADVAGAASGMKCINLSTRRID